MKQVLDAAETLRVAQQRADTAVRELTAAQAKLTEAARNNIEAKALLAAAFDQLTAAVTAEKEKAK